MNRVWLTPFSAPLESTRSPEVNSHHEEQSKFSDLQRVYSILSTATTTSSTVNGIEGWPGIVSRFQLVLLAGRRSKQLFEGALPRIPADPLKRRNTSIALEELRLGLVLFSQNGNKSQTIPTAIETSGDTTLEEQVADSDLRKAE